MVVLIWQEMFGSGLSLLRIPDPIMATLKQWFAVVHSNLVEGEHEQRASIGVVLAIYPRIVVFDLWPRLL